MEENALTFSGLDWDLDSGKKHVQMSLKTFRLQTVKISGFRLSWWQHFPSMARRENISYIAAHSIRSVSFFFLITNR